uniref:BPI fold containing family A member 2 n=1 Tax=Rousettus aegyptiacus TaxID=9407 RepID=A0A7J8DFF9_ROUAE|nr:BPI fold containing family A member 2 [Rousettus aegyptiacus]
MFQLWKVVLLCGLLTGTSASPLESVPEDLGGSANRATPTLDGGLNALDNTLEAVPRRQKDNVAALQDSNVWQLAQKELQDIKNLVNNGLSSILPINVQDLGVKISDTRVLDVKAELAPDHENLNLRFSITVKVTQSLPFIGQVVNLKASLNLLTGVRIETNVKTGHHAVVQRECKGDPGSIQLTLLGGWSELVNNFVNLEFSATSKIVSSLVQQQVCPLIEAITSNLNVDFVQKIIINLQQGVQQQISI